MNPQAKIMFTSFIYFALVMEKNKEIPKSLKNLFYKLSYLTKMYQDRMEEVLEEANILLKGVDKDVDYLLLSVTILAEYYDQLKGKKKYFRPMSHKEILALQDECLEMDDTMARDTFDVAELLVKGFLNARLTK